MLRLMLDGNPALHCPGEMDYILDHIVRDGLSARVKCEELGRDRVFRTAGLDLPAKPDALDAVSDILGQLRSRSNGALVVIIHRNIGRLLQLYPELRVLHLIRDPRDVARSSIGMGWAGNVYHGVDHWIATETEWDRCRSNLAPGNVMELTYEALVSDPATSLGEVCAFFGCPYDDRMLAYAERSTYSSPDTSLVNQWQSKQSPKEVSLVESKVGPMLRARGYDPSGLAPQAPGMLRRLGMSMQDRLARWRHQIDRYGLRDVVQLWVGRRFALRSLAWPAEDRIDEKTKYYLK